MHMYGNNIELQEIIKCWKLPHNLSNEDELTPQVEYMSNMYFTPRCPSHFPSTDHPTNQANRSYMNETYSSQQHPQLPPPLPCHYQPCSYSAPRFSYHSPPLLYNSPPELHPFQLPSTLGNTIYHPIKLKKNANTLPSAVINNESQIPPTQTCTIYSTTNC